METKCLSKKIRLVLDDAARIDQSGQSQLRRQKKRAAPMEQPALDDNLNEIRSWNSRAPDLPVSS